MTSGRLVHALGLCGVVVFGVVLTIASGSNNNNPASMTPTNPIVKVEQNSGPVIVAPHVPLHYAALPLASTQNGVQISFNAPSPTTLKVVLLDPQSGTSTQPPVITAAENLPASTSTTGFVRTDSYDTNQTPLLWNVTVRPPDSFYALGTFTANISVVSLDPSSTGNAHESPPLSLVMETFRIRVAVSGGSGAAITSTPNGIACGRGGDCIHDFPPASGSPNSLVQLIPANTSPDGLTCFKSPSWSGLCSGSGVCQVVLDGTNTVSVSATFDAGHPCNPAPAICTAPQQSTPLCQPSAANSSGIASCVDDNGWFCCSMGAQTNDNSDCPTGTGPAYGAIECPPGGGTPSNRGCQ